MKNVKYLHKYFSENLWFAKTIYVLAGMGLGFLLAYPLAGEHPIRWGVGFLVIAAALHLYPLIKKGKKG